MDAFKLTNLIVQQQQSDKLYLEFLKAPALSMGVYSLPAGSTDPQQPHTEDEVYYVAYGRATIRVGAEERAVVPGSIVYVPALVEHRFHDISEDLTVLVFFAPAEYSQRAANGKAN
ncbi:MAG TPA: cupin domain-containing protein [Phototrophicaceae bacterium]|nr:cupin domain-containing protein [Phototrophicaceae bacterium]